MSQWEKLLASVRNNPKDVRFDDACKIAERLGFVCGKPKGSHHAYSRHGEPTQLNFQNHSGKIPLYQARQLIEMIELYAEEP